MKPKFYLIFIRKIFPLLLFFSSFFKIQAECGDHDKFIINLRKQSLCTRTGILRITQKIPFSLDQIRYSIGEVIIENTTISNSGSYVLGKDIDCPLIIDANNVIVDLNGYSIYGTCTAITIEENRENILIKNGSLNGAEDCNFICSRETTNDTSGIWIKGGAQLITIDDLKIFGFENGIFFDGSLAEIESGTMKNTILFCNKKGAMLHNTIKTVWRNCEALNNHEAGFELDTSNFNCFEQCRALETKNDDPEKSAIGFCSTSGEGNLFVECIVNGTEKGGESTFCNNAEGFSLKATSTLPGETKTEIFNCIVSKTTGSGEGNAYGIHLDATLKETDPLIPLGEDYQITTTNTLNTVRWSPEPKFIATGQDYEGNNYTLQVHSFEKGTSATVGEVNLDGAASTQDVLSLSWAPKGNYIAVGAEDGSGDELFIYEFDSSKTTDSLTKIASDSDDTTYGPIGGTVNSVDWSPKDTYIAVGTAVTDYLQIWGFDGTTLSQFATDNTIASSVTGVSFSPNGEYVAAIYGTNLEIFIFNTIADQPLESIVSETGYGGDLNSIHWSPIACNPYILAVGGTVSGSENIQVFTFDSSATSNQLQSLTTTESLEGTEINAVRWSPNGKYLLTAGDNSTSNNSVEIFSFNASTPSLTSEDQGTNPVDANDCDWSPSGRYAAASGTDGGADDYVYIYEPCNVPQDVSLRITKSTIPREDSVA